MVFIRRLKYIFSLINIKIFKFNLAKLSRKIKIYYFLPRLMFLILILKIILRIKNRHNMKKAATNFLMKFKSHSNYIEVQMHIRNGKSLLFMLSINPST